MRRYLLLFLCILLLCGSVSAANNKITKMDAQVQVDSEGVCRITVAADVQFTDGTQRFVFPLGKDADDITASGASFEEERNGDVDCIVFQNPMGFSGKQSFLCSYTLPCALTESSSGQHFSLQLPTEGWDYAISDFQLTVNFPYDISDYPSWSSAYYGDVIDNYLSIQVNGSTVTTVSNVEFKDHETLTMKLDFPAETFDLRHLAGQTTSVVRLMFWSMLLLSLAYWFLRMKAPLLRERSEEVFRFDSSAGEVPCQLFGLLPDLGALLAYWGSLGYILICKTRRGNITIEKQMEMGNERSTAERRIFSAMFRSSDSCDLDSPRFLAANAEAAVLRSHWLRRVYKSGSGQPRILRILTLLAGLFMGILLFDLWLPASPSRWVWLPLLSVLTVLLCGLVQSALSHIYRRDWWIYLPLGIVSLLLLLIFAGNAGCLPLMLLNLLLQLGCAYVTLFGASRSTPGEELLDQLLGLRRFLLRTGKEELQHHIRSDSQYFYRTLPYAEIFGIGPLFSRRCAELSKESCLWLIDERHPLRGGKDFYPLYKQILQQIRLKCRLSRGFSLWDPTATASSSRRSSSRRSTPRRGSSVRNHRPRTHSSGSSSVRRRTTAGRSGRK